MKPNWINSWATSSGRRDRPWARSCVLPSESCGRMVERAPQSPRCLLPGGRSVALSEGRLEPKSAAGSHRTAGSALGLEAEMSQEDREFEGAKNFVKMAADAVKSATAAAPGVNPVAAAKAAVKAAVETRACTPWWRASGRTALGQRQFGRTGRWVRQGRNVIIVNCG